MTLCPECEKRPRSGSLPTCYPCHVRSIGFTFRGAGYGRDAWNGPTIAEREREIRQNPNAEKV